MSTVLSRLGNALGRFVHGPDVAEMRVGPGGPTGDIGFGSGWKLFEISSGSVR